MMYYMGLLSIVFAVSLDGLSVGITYGMRKITLSFISLLIIVTCSGMIVIGAMTLGHFIRMFISPQLTSILGGSILILLGLFVLCSSIRSSWRDHQGKVLSEASATTTTNHTQHNLHHLKAVLSNPENADRDQSGTISPNEALILGIALALDAFGAGLGAAMLGFSILATPLLIALMSGIFVYTGIKVGLLLSKNNTIGTLTFLPPLLLISIGIINLF